MKTFVGLEFVKEKQDQRIKRTRGRRMKIPITKFRCPGCSVCFGTAQAAHQHKPDRWITFCCACRTFYFKDPDSPCNRCQCQQYSCNNKSCSLFSTNPGNIMILITKAHRNPPQPDNSVQLKSLDQRLGCCEADINSLKYPRYADF